MNIVIIFIFFNLLKIIISYDFHKFRFATKVVQGANDNSAITGNFITPIVLGTTFSQNLLGDKPGKYDPNSHGQGYFYSRMGNPTRGELEKTLALIENANYSAVFSSGMASISTIIQLLNYSNHVIAIDDLYGGTTTYFKNIVTSKNGIHFTFLDVNEFDNLEKYINSDTRMIWLESLTNPLLKTVDIKKISKIAKKYNLLLVIDSTFTSPYLFNPLDWGVDLVVHSATKYIGGHSDILMGAIMCNDKNLIKKIRFFQSSIGSVPSPFECYLALRGLKTLHLRMDASQKNALKIAKFLESHNMVEKVIYPGLKSYDNYRLVKKQFRGSGSIISIYIKGDVNKFLKSLKIFKLAVSLGAVESLLCCPALMTHIGISKDIRESIGITDNLIRISVGIEDATDLIDDIKQAFSQNDNFENYNKIQD